MCLFVKSIVMYSCLSILVLTPVMGETENSATTLDVEHILALARQNNPSREIFEATRAVADAEVLSSSAWSNPELEVNAGRARARDGSGERENIHGLELKQRLELPNKRASRIAAAKSGRRLVENEYGLDQFALECELRQACLELALTEETLELARTAGQIAEEVHQLTLARHAAKENDAGELSRAKLELINATMARDRQERQVAAGRALIQTWCNGNLPENFAIQGALFETLPTISREEAMIVAEQNHPRLKMLLAQRDTMVAGLRREEKVWLPDVTLGGFSERESDSNSQGLSFGVEIPLWNRNQGGVALARAESRKADAELRAMKKMIYRDIELAWQAYDQQRQALVTFMKDAEEVAQQVVRAKMIAYAAKEASIAEVLESRRAAQAVKAEILEARRSASEAWLKLGQAAGSYKFAHSNQSMPKPIGGQQ